MVVSPQVSPVIMDALLNYWRPARGAQTPPAQNTANGISPISAGHIAPSFFDTITKLSSTPAGFNEIPAEHHASLHVFRPDSVAIRDQPQLEGKEFERVVMEWLQKTQGNDEGFQTALKSGAIKIQRAVDIPELGFRSYIYDMEKDGHHIGSVTGSTLNEDWLNARRAEGGYHNVGTAGLGQNYYVSW